MRIVPRLILLTVLVASLPLFLCMPLWADTTLFDLATRNVLQGGVHYRDIFDTNPPGMVWLHLVVRSLLGWSSIAIRLADLVVVATIGWLLLRWAKAGSAWLAVALAIFYFSLPETCHCQRDTWMLLPALAALSLRRRQMMNPSVVLAVIEGLLWGAAFWIKPHVAVPAVASFFMAVGLARRASVAWQRILLDAAGVLGGGLLAGALGSLWLIESGTWPYFWQTMLGWNQEYYAGILANVPHHLRNALTMFAPWGLAHVLALPLAVLAVRRGSERALLAAFYLGWFVQSGFLQSEFDYIQVPPILLALTLIAGGGYRVGPVAVGWMAATTAAASLLLLPAVGAALEPLRLQVPRVYHWVFGQSHAFIPQRLAWWCQCWREGSTPAVQDALRVANQPYPSEKQDLERVAAYLRTRALGDGELTCYNDLTHPLYLELNLKPSTRFLHFNTVRERFASRNADIDRELAQSRQRLVVSDLGGAGLGAVQLAAEAQRSELVLPATFPAARRHEFPWSLPIVYRAGRYVVQEVEPGCLSIAATR